MVEFNEKDALGGWSVAVVLNRLVVGHIRRQGNGGFGYYKGPDNHLTWAFEDDDLEALKSKVDSLIRGA
ncbi:MAG: hypothetical protein WC213_04220 [Arenimonas sp.]|jgi:hypothetical protein